MGSVKYPVRRRASVKDVIEALGPPHGVVGGLMINGINTDFTPLLHPGDHVEVFPFTPPVDVTKPTLLRPKPLPGLAFLVDANVGKLGRLIRVLGFDAATANDEDDSQLAALAFHENRIVITKDRALLKHSKIAYGHLIRCEEPQEQLRSFLDYFGLAPPFRPFSRCLECNTSLRPVAKEAILHRLEPKTKKYFDAFQICPDCERIYWPGSHHQHMRNWLAALAHT